MRDQAGSVHAEKRRAAVLVVVVLRVDRLHDRLEANRELGVGLEHLLRDGSASLIDTLAIEWHTSKRGQGGAKTALIRRQAKIVSGFTRAGCKVVDWKL